MPPALCLPPAVLDHSFPREQKDLLRVSRALGALEENVDGRKCSLLLTSAMTVFVEMFEWNGVRSYPLLQAIHGLLVQWLLQPTSGVRLVTCDPNLSFIPHPLPEESGDGVLIDLWREETGRIYAMHIQCGEVRPCVGVACDHAYSGGALGKYIEPAPPEHFPLAGPNETAALEDFEVWAPRGDIHQLQVSYTAARENVHVLGGVIASKAEGSHFKVTFPGKRRPWPLDYNIDPIPDRFLRSLAAIVELPVEVVKHTLLCGEMPPRRPRF